MQPTVDPRKVRVRGAWALVREDAPPKASTGGIIIPETSKLKGRRNTKATVIAVGDGSAKGGGSYEMPEVGNRILIPCIAGLPDTPSKQAQMFQMPDEVDGSKYYLVHAMDILAQWAVGEDEPEVE